MAETVKPKQRARTKKFPAVIDRIEDGDMAVVILEDDTRARLDLHVSRLPTDARSDGDHLLLTFEISADGETRTLKKIEAAPQRRAKAEDRIKQMQERLEKQSDTAGQKDFKL